MGTTSAARRQGLDGMTDFEEASCGVPSRLFFWPHFFCSSLFLVSPQVSLSDQNHNNMRLKQHFLVSEAHTHRGYETAQRVESTEEESV